jgi:hypothetical protein
MTILWGSLSSSFFFLFFQIFQNLSRSCFDSNSGVGCMISSPSLLFPSWFLLFCCAFKRPWRPWLETPSNVYPANHPKKKTDPCRFFGASNASTHEMLQCFQPNGMEWTVCYPLSTFTTTTSSRPTDSNMINRKVQFPTGSLQCGLLFFFFCTLIMF